MQQGISIPSWEIKDRIANGNQRAEYLWNHAQGSVEKDSKMPNLISLQRDSDPLGLITTPYATQRLWEVTAEKGLLGGHEAGIKTGIFITEKPNTSTYKKYPDLERKRNPVPSIQLRDILAEVVALANEKTEYSLVPSALIGGKKSQSSSKGYSLQDLGNLRMDERNNLFSYGMKYHLASNAVKSTNEGDQSSFLLKGAGSIYDSYRSLQEYRKMIAQNGLPQMSPTIPNQGNGTANRAFDVGSVPKEKIYHDEYTFMDGFSIKDKNYTTKKKANDSEYLAQKLGLSEKEFEDLGIAGSIDLG